MIASFIEILGSLWKNFGQDIKENSIKVDFKNENEIKIISFFERCTKKKKNLQKKQIFENKIKIWKRKKIIKNKIQKNLKLHIFKKQEKKENKFDEY